MDMPQVGQLVLFVLLVSIPLLLLEVAMRRSNQSRGPRRTRDGR
jgi:SNF family Na+-dependent transporter